MLPKLIATFVGLLTLSSLNAQILDLTSWDEFSDESIMLRFSRSADGVNLENFAARLGVRFAGEGGSQPVAEGGFLPPFTLLNFLRNAAPEGSTSAGRSLIIRFDRPVLRVGAGLSNGDESTEATVSALTASGRLLGTISRTEIEEQGGPFAGIETTDPEGISILVVSYGDSPREEQISLLQFEFVEPPLFKQCFAQVVDGPAGANRLRTILQVQNLSDPQTARLELFNSAGDPMPVELNGQTSATFDLELDFTSSLTLESAGNSDPAAIGYACLKSRLPVAAQAIFRVENGEDVISEAGIPAAEILTTDQFFVVEYNPDRHINTGIAVANPGEVEVVVLFTSPNGGSELRPLGPRQHSSFFLNELFEHLETPFRGTLRINESKGVAVTVLRTFKGLPMSSLPAGSWETSW